MYHQEVGSLYSQVQASETQAGGLHRKCGSLESQENGSWRFSSPFYREPFRLKGDGDLPEGFGDCTES